MSRNLTNFEQSVKNTLDTYEVPYNEASWESIESHLGGAGSNMSSGMLAAVISGFIVISAAIGFILLNQSEYANGASVHKTLKIDRSLQFEGIQNKFVQAQENMLLAQMAEQNIDSYENSDDPSAFLSKEPNTKSTSSQEVSANATNKVNVAANADMSGMTVLKSGDNEQGKSKHISPETRESEELSFEANVREACVGSSVQFELITGAMEGNYLWNFGDGNFSNKSNPNHVFKKPGAYDISLSVTSNDDGVIRSKSINNMIVINPTPHADFDWEFVNDPSQFPTVKFTNTSDKASESHWEFDLEKVSDEINPTSIYKEQGKHAVKLTVSNEYGCTDSHYQYISIDADFNLLAPKSISPDGDGYNDYFMPETLILNDYQFKLTVYNGKQPIFETYDNKRGWDGVLPDGTIAKPGESYPWVVIIYNDYQEEQEYFSGTVAIAP